MKSSNDIQIDPDNKRVVRWDDPSLWVLLLGNLFSIGLAIIQRWPMHEIMWIYWAQSVTIGVINYCRMMSLKEFTTEGLKMNDSPVPETEEAKRDTAGFFALHYGVFHLVYFFFLWEAMPLNKIAPEDLMLLLLCVIGFVGSHLYSFRYNFADDFRQKKPNLGTLLFYPYLRIIPMHLAIIFGSGSQGFGILIFMGLKTFADIGMHMIERHLFRKPDNTAPFQMKD